ncbi:MAG TPA: hypothetical protein DIT09_08505 [Glutamicibacter sp.]|nr:hypothetical protein [Glutamicibacter sp.]
MSNDALLVLDKVCKSFGSVQVIDEVTVEVHAGKVSVLLGENGAGKSTLIKMIAGVHEPDAGRILMDGNAVKIPNTKASEALGIATIHQELNLVPSMTIAENITLGRVPRKFGIINRRAMRQVAREAMDKLGLNLDVNTPVGELGLAQQQLVEIAKALSLDARVLILDEPTEGIQPSVIKEIGAVIKMLAARGDMAILLVEQFYDFAEELADQYLVMSRGEIVQQGRGENMQTEGVRGLVTI